MSNHIDPNIARVLREAMVREGWRNGQAALIDHPADRGSLTRGGVTAKTWGAYKRLGRSATAAELLAITEGEALQFYFTEFVLAPRLDLVLDQQLRALLVDWGFTSGPATPIKALQASFKSRGIYTGSLDGKIGPQTKAAIFADREPRTAFCDVYNARVVFYTRLAFDSQVQRFLQTNPTSQLHNLRGWLARTLEFTPS